MHMFQLNNGSFFTYAIVSIIRSKGRRFGPVTRIRRNPPPNETMNSFDKQEPKKRTQRIRFSFSLFLSTCLRVLRAKGWREEEQGGRGSEYEKTIAQASFLYQPMTASTRACTVKSTFDSLKRSPSG